MIDKIIYTILLVGLISDIILNLRGKRTILLRKIIFIKSILLQLIALFTLVIWREAIDVFIVGWIVLIYFVLYLPQAIYVVLTIAVKNRMYRRVVMIACSLLSLVMIYGMTIGINSSCVKSVIVESDRLPHSFNNLRIVHITDLHLKGQNPNSRFLKNVVDKINDIEPDIVVVTGDFVTYKGEEFRDFEELFSQIRSKYGVYGVLGNHDYCAYYKWDRREDAEKSMNELLVSLERIDWKILSNQSDQLVISGDTINIIGVEHLGGHRPRGSVDKAIQNIDTVHFNLLLSHTPETWERDIVANYPIDLTISGHTHAMQFKIDVFGKQYSPSSMIFKQWSGLYSQNGRYLYVNDGLGYTGIPMRLGAVPEITLITLVCGE